MYLSTPPTLPHTYSEHFSQETQVRMDVHKLQIAYHGQSGLPFASSILSDALNARNRSDVFTFAYPPYHPTECDDKVPLRQLLRTFLPGTGGDAGNMSQLEVNKILQFKAVRTRSALELVLDYMDQPHEHMSEVAETDTAAFTLSVRTDSVLLGGLSNASASSTDGVGQGPGASLTLGGVIIGSSPPGLPPNAINVCDDETRVALPTDLPYFWYDEPQPQPVEASNGVDEDVMLDLPTDLVYFWPT